MNNCILSGTEILIKFNSRHVHTHAPSHTLIHMAHFDRGNNQGTPPICHNCHLIANSVTQQHVRVSVLQLSKQFRQQPSLKSWDCRGKDRN